MVAARTSCSSARPPRALVGGVCVVWLDVSAARRPLVGVSGLALSAVALRLWVSLGWLCRPSRFACACRGRVGFGWLGGRSVVILPGSR